MSKKFKGMEHQIFVLCGEGLELVNNGGSIVLSETYFDNSGEVNGQPGLVKYVTSKSREGKELGKRFRFDLSFRRLLTRDTDKDFNGLSQYKWLKNYPQCEGSPNGEYVEIDGNFVQRGVLFREMNDAKDAEIALQADEERVNAQATALGLDEETLQEVGAILGHYGAPDKLMRLRVVEYAGKKPKNFNEILSAGDRTIRSLVRRALSDGIFRMKGTVIYWGDTVVGADEDKAVAMLLSDLSMQNALREKFGIPIAEEAKKPRGNPNFKKQKLENSL